MCTPRVCTCAAGMMQPHSTAVCGVRVAAAVARCTCLCGQSWSVWPAICCVCLYPCAAASCLDQLLRCARTWTVRCDREAAPAPLRQAERGPRAGRGPGLGRPTRAGTRAAESEQAEAGGAVGDGECGFPLHLPFAVLHKTEMVPPGLKEPAWHQVLMPCRLLIGPRAIHGVRDGPAA